MRFAIRFSCCLMCAGLASVPAPAQDGPYTDAFLSGIYQSHDLFAQLNGNGTIATGLRNYDGNGRLVSLLSFASRSPLDYQVRDDGLFALSATGHSPGLVGGLGIGGMIAVQAPQFGAGADQQVPAGYGALRISVERGRGYRNSDFSGAYSYHALLYSGGTWWNAFGAGQADGASRLRQFRDGAPPWDLNYRVADTGATEIGDDGPAYATLMDDGAVLIQTVSARPNENPFFPQAHSGLAVFARRSPATSPMTLDRFRGTYQVFELRVRPGGANRARAGTVTAGGPGVFYGQLGNDDFAGRIELFPSGVFRLRGSDRAVGTLTAGGDVAVLATESGQVSGGNGEAYFQIWLRTAGGRPVPGDADGDGVRDEVELARGTNPNNPDTDGDGWLDNVDPDPLVPNNVHTATLNPSTLTLTEGESALLTATLILDSGNFPFFDWSLNVSEPWVTLLPGSGEGDGTVTVQVNPANLVAADSPYTASIQVDAPYMRATPPVVLQVNVERNAIAIEATPPSLAFTAVEGASPPPPRTVAIASPDAPGFSWDAAADRPWLAVAPPSGTGPATLTVSLSMDGLSAAPNPYQGTVTVTSRGARSTAVAVPVSLTVLPPRGQDQPFLVSPGAGQAAPAIAYDPASRRYLAAWQQGGQVFAMLLDADGTPVFGPRAISQAAEGVARRPAVVVAPDARIGYIVWEQERVEGPDVQLQLQYRTIQLDSLSLRPFPAGLPTTGGNLTAPVVAYHAGRDEIAVLYIQFFEDETTLRLLQIDPATAIRIRDREVAEAYAAPATLSGHSLAERPGSDEYGIAWLEGRDQGGAFLPERAVFRRFPGDGEADPEDVVVLSDAAGRETAVAASPVNEHYAVVFENEERRILLHRIPFDQPADRETVPPFATRGSGEGLALAFSPEAEQFLAVWSGNPEAVNRRLAFQWVTAGGYPIKPEGQAVPLGNGATAPATVFNPEENEFLALWATPGGVAAMRIDAGSTDEDGDGLPNDWEFRYGLDPLDPTGDNGADGDPDNDGLTNLEEYRMGTSPILADTDGDGLLDRQEDRNRDGNLDPDETSPFLTDTDGDGADDAVEWFMGTNGNDASDVPDSGLFRFVYDPPQPGAASDLSVYAFIREPGVYSLYLNSPGQPGWHPPGEWEMSGDTARFDEAFEAGTHRFDFTLWPPDEATPASNHAVLAFRLVGPSVDDTLTAELVAELRNTGPGVEGPDADELARRHAPVLRTHRDAFLPLVRVEDLWERVDLHTAPGRRFRFTPEAFDLYQSPQREAYLDFPGETIEALADAFPDDGPAAVYFTVTPLDGPSAAQDVPEGHTVIQYYLFFPGDGWGFQRRGGHRHEGDWEMAQVLLDETLAPYRLTVTQHRRAAALRNLPGGASYPWDRVETVAGRHPILFVGRGSHSLNVAPGSTRHDGALDVHDGLGRWYYPDTDEAEASLLGYPSTTAYELAALGRLHEETPRDWLRFAGRWGQPDYPSGPEDVTDAALRQGPRGPAFLAVAPADGPPIRPWSDPWAWARHAPVPPVPLPAIIEGALPEALYGHTVVLFDARGRVFRTKASPDNGAFRFTVPTQHYTLHVVETNPIGQETWLASARFETGHGESLLFPTLPQGAVTPLGTFILEDGALRGDRLYALSDADNDGVPDYLDDDADNDGLPNTVDDDPLGDGFADAYQIQDPDNDGIPTYYDPDPYGDGETRPDGPSDNDGDGFIDAVDLDWDNDGFTNAEEIAAGTDPWNFYDSPAWRIGDIDGDGKRSIVDAQRIVNMALRREPYHPRADFDADGNIDAYDIHAILRIILDATE